MNENREFNKEKIISKMKYLKGILEEGFPLNPRETMRHNADEVILLLSILESSTVGLGEHISKRGMDNMEKLYCDVFTGISTLLIPADAEESVRKVLEGSNFGDRERLVIQRYYLDEEPKTLSLIGYEIGVSSNRVAQIRKKALRKMGNPVNSKILTYGINVCEKAEALRKELAEKYITEEIAEEKKLAEAADHARQVHGTHFLDMSIDELILSVRAYNCLRRAGIDTIGDLLNKTELDLHKVRNLGAKSIEEIKTRLAEKGLRMKTEEEAEKERLEHEATLNEIRQIPITAIEPLQEAGIVEILKGVHKIMTVGDLMKIPEKVIIGLILSEKVGNEVIDTVKQLGGEFRSIGRYSWEVPSIYEFDLRQDTLKELKSKGINTLKPFFDQTTKVSIETFDDVRKSVIHRYLSI